MEEAAWKERLEDGLLSREADGSFLSCSLTEVPGTMPGPDVGGRSQGVRVGDAAPREGEVPTLPPGWVPALGQRGGWSQLAPSSGLAGLQQSASPSSLSSTQSPGTRRETRNRTVSEDIGAFDQTPMRAEPGECPLPLGTPHSSRGGRKEVKP